ETAFTGLWIAPEWRRRGYGSYLLRQVLHRCGGYSREQASLFTAPLPAGEGGAAFWGKFGFVPEGDRLVRRRGSEERTSELHTRSLDDALPISRPLSPACGSRRSGGGGATAPICCGRCSTAAAATAGSRPAFSPRPCPPGRGRRPSGASSALSPRGTVWSAA